MLKEAINRILDLAAPNLVTINGEQYADKPLHRLPHELTAAPLSVHTLTAVLDYITNGTDEMEDNTDRRFVIHVSGHDSVCLYHELNVDKARECLLDVSVDPTVFPFGRWLSVEDFIIRMQAHFVPSDNVNALVKLVSTVTDENSITVADDGITQKATAKSGIQMVKQVAVPNPIALAPYRTFNEIAQPESSFVFRVRKGADGVEAALFTADGNAWQNDAIIGIRDYLLAELPAEYHDEVIILA